MYYPVLCLAFSFDRITGSIGQIILIIKIDYSKPVTTLQLQLERLKVYSLQTLRLLFLSIPFYFAYIIVGFKLLFKLDIYAHADSKWLLWNIILSIAFCTFISLDIPETKLQS